MQTYSYLVADSDSLRQKLEASQYTQSYCTLIQILSTQSTEQVTQYCQLLTPVFPQATIIGQSSSHLVHQGKISDQGTLIIISQFANSTLTCAQVTLSDNSQNDGLQLTASLRLKGNSKAVISYADGTKKDSRVCSMFNTIQSGVPVAGGIAVKGLFGSWVLLGQQFYQQSCVAVALHGDALHAWQAYFSEWHPIGRRLTVTKAHRNRLYQLDQINAQDIYDHYLADGNRLCIDELKSFPLMRGQSACQDILRPIALNDDGSIEFNRPLIFGEKLRFCYNHPALTLEQVRQQAQALQNHQPQAIFSYTCTSRLNLMQGNEELRPLQVIAPISGSYCSGELCQDDGEQRLLHHSMTYLALREGDIEQDAPIRPLPECDKRTSPLFTLLRHAIADAGAMQESMQYQLEVQTEKLTQSYRVDALTNLPNRIALNDRMKKMHLNEHLLTMKLTNFPQINEKYGYRIGDQLLVDISHYFSEKLLELIAGPAQLFCTGVGEWACIFKSEMLSTMLRQKVYDFTLQLEQINFKPEGIPDQDHLTVSVSAGIISRRDFPDIPPDKVLFKAIEARRIAKRNNRHVYSAKQVQAEKESQQSQLSWLSVVSKAILEQNVIPFAQPIVKAGSHQQISLECLVRIRQAGRIINPGQFLPIIEGTHLYTRLSRQMIDSTFSIMRDREEAFSINLSPQDLMNDKTIQLLERNLLTLNDTSRVGLEILESEQIKDYGRMLEVCGHLRAMGTRIIVDDFGSGYSNIDEIIQLEPQIVKLDGSLIRNIDINQRQRKVAKTMVQLCEVIGAKTIAEFVHNREVCRIAEDMGIDYLQGYYLGEPKPLA